MEFELVILGSNSAIPLLNRNPSSQFLTIASRHFLIDCGEGTQVQLRRNKIGFGRINHIFISHLHGDHFFGLVSLLSTLHLLDRKKELNIYCPVGLEEILKVQFRHTNTWLKYPLKFHFLEKGKKDIIYEDDKIQVLSFPLDHSIDCWGFLFEEKPRPRNISKDALAKYSIPVAELRSIKNGGDWKSETGERISNEELTRKPSPSLSYAYCTDTAPIEDLTKYIDGVDLLYHEATFLDRHAERAFQTKHTTAKQAAEIANKVNAKHLLLGHFSTRYDDISDILSEAKEIFEQSFLAREQNRFVLTSSLLETEISING